MNRISLFLLTVAIVLGSRLEACGQAAGVPPDADPLRRQLNDATAKYREAVTGALQSVYEALDRQFEQAQKRGDFENAKAYKDAKDALQQKGELPKLTAVRADRNKAEQAIARAQAEFISTYEDVRKAYTKNKNFEKAEIVDKELKALKARVIEQPKAGVRTAVVAEVFLSDLQEQNLDPIEGHFGKNGQHPVGEKLRAESVVCPKAILLTPPSHGRRQVTYSVPAGFSRFRSRCGLHDNGGPSRSPLTFKVLNEKAEEIWASEAITLGCTKTSCDIALEGIRTITLVVECSGSCENANAIWVDPRFIR
jgi:hypothetical protein